jgi:hypothetical protein
MGAAGWVYEWWYTYNRREKVTSNQQTLVNFET